MFVDLLVCLLGCVIACEGGLACVFTQEREREREAVLW